MSTDYFADREVVGRRLRATARVRGSARQPVRGGWTERNRWVEPGEELTCVRHGFGPGGDPAFEATLKTDAGEVVHVDTGWLCLRRDQWEVLP